MHFGMNETSSNPLFNYGMAEWQAEPVTAFDAYLSSYRFEQRRLRPSSFVIYKGMFSRLLEWAAAQQLSLFAISASGLEQFLASKRLSAETRHRYLLLFTSLFAHLAHLQVGASSAVNAAEDNPARTLLLEREAPTREDPTALNRLEVQRFIGQLPPATNWKRRRDRALVFLVLGAGLRVSEVLALKLSELSFKSDTLEGVWVREHKPRPARWIPIQPWVIPEIAAWLQERAILASGHAPRQRGRAQQLAGDLLIPANLAGARLQPTTFSRLVKAALDQAGIVKRYEGPTLLRNSCGTYWLERYEPLQVSLWMGHATVRTTQLLLPPGRRTKPDLFK
jgi:integrase